MMAAKERPILFSAPMVRAILAGTKTQTRRVVKPQPELAQLLTASGWSAWHNEKWQPLKNSFGRPGNRLYVRETWRVGARWDDSKPSDIPPNSCTVLYRAGGFTTNGDNGERIHGERIHGGECSNPEWAGKTRTAIHMPRWASRIDLEVTGVRVERLQDISEADARAEGCPCYVCGRAMDGCGEGDCHCFHRQASASDYRTLWESINGAGSWEANPWVWVVEFARVKP